MTDLTEDQVRRWRDMADVPDAGFMVRKILALAEDDLRLRGELAQCAEDMLQLSDIAKGRGGTITTLVIERDEASDQLERLREAVLPRAEGSVGAYCRICQWWTYWNGNERHNPKTCPLADLPAAARREEEEDV